MSDLARLVLNLDTKLKPLFERYQEQLKIANELRDVLIGKESANGTNSVHQARVTTNIVLATLALNEATAAERRELEPSLTTPDIRPVDVRAEMTVSSVGSGVFVLIGTEAVKLRPGTRYMVEFTEIEESPMEHVLADIVDAMPPAPWPATEA